MDKFIHYGLAAGVQAFRDSGLEVNEANAHRIGVNIGSGIGGLPMIEDTHDDFLAGGARKISLLHSRHDHQHDLRQPVDHARPQGPNIAVVTACTTGLHAIGMSARMIEYGDADVMVCGGAESTVTPLAVGGFAAKALSTRNDDPATASRRGTRTVMASCSAKALACWCSKSTSTRSSVAPDLRRAFRLRHER
jgi:3-oxoacyl-[acyl-carrier-protein] synthase II